MNNKMNQVRRELNELALFAGAGGGILGSRLLGWRTVGAVEIDPYCREVLLRRQEEKILEPFPIWDDITTFDGRPWRGIVDVVSGGFPCQDISAAGKGAGITGARSGLWTEMARVVQEVQPQYVFVENWGMMRGGVLLGVSTLVRASREIGCGYWPAPRKALKDFKIVNRKDYQGNLEEYIGREHPELIGSLVQPCLCEWLMMWPAQWTGMQPLAMAKFQRWRRSHGDCLVENEEIKELEQ